MQIKSTVSTLNNNFLDFDSKKITILNDRGLIKREKVEKQINSARKRKFDEIILKPNFEKGESNSGNNDHEPQKYENVKNGKAENYEIIDLDKQNPNFNYKKMKSDHSNDLISISPLEKDPSLKFIKSVPKRSIQTLRIESKGRLESEGEKFSVNQENKKACLIPQFLTGATERNKTFRKLPKISMFKN